MLEWNTTDNHTPLPSDDPDPSPRRRMNLRVLIGLFFLIVGIGIGIMGVLWWRTRLAEAQIRTDLLLFIRREEQARRFGLEEQAEQFMAEGVPEPWQARYKDSFTPPPAEPLSVTVEIAALDLQGQDALVQVRLGRHVQERRYRQTTEGWRRVPLNPSERGNNTTYEQGGMTFQYRAADADFARELIVAYPDLIDLWKVWGGTLPEINRVSIDASEFMRPAYVVESTLNVATPSIVSLPTHWDLTGEEAMRYWVAREIGGHVTFSRISSALLPGNDRFIKALITVTSLRWAGVEEPYTRLTVRWRDIAATHSGSSFYDMPHQSQPIDPFAPTPQEAAALLIADALYTKGGNEQILLIVRTMSNAQQWDTVFETATGLTTLEFETLARGGPIPIVLLESPLLQGHPLPNDARMPFEGFQLQVDGYDLPIWVETTDETNVFLSDGTAVAIECATTFSEISIEGNWYESGLRLAADRIVGTSAPFPNEIVSVPAPQDTLYYVTAFQPDSNGQDTNQLIAVRADGTRISVWSYPNMDFYSGQRSFAQQATPLQGIAAVGSIVRNCPLQWVMRYQPENGNVNTWLFQGFNPIGTPVYLWDEERSVGLVAAPIFSEGAGQHQYWMLRPDDDESSHAKAGGRLPVGEPWMLRPGKDEVLIYHYRENRLFLYDLVGEREIWSVALEPEHYFGTIVFDPTGRYLYVTITEVETNPDNYLPERSTITRFDLQTGNNSLIWNRNMGGVGIVAVDAFVPRLYAILERAEDDHATVLYFENEEWHPVRAAPPEEAIYNLLPCRQGGALFLQSANPLTEGEIPMVAYLHFIAPNGQLGNNPVALDLEGGEFPIAC